MAEPDKKKKKKKKDPNYRLSKFAEQNPAEFARIAALDQGEFNIPKPSIPNKSAKWDKIEKLWSEFKNVSEQYKKLTQSDKQTLRDLGDPSSLPKATELKFRGPEEKLTKLIEEALHCLNSIIELDENNYAAWLNKGIVLEDTNQLDEALKCFEKITIHLKPDSFRAWVKRIEVLILQDKPSNEKLDCMNKALEIFSGDDSQLFGIIATKGMIYGIEKKWDEALKCLNEANEKSNYKISGIWLNIGIALANMDKHREAIDCFKKTLELEQNAEKKENSRQAHWNIYVAYFNLEEYRTALDHLKQAVQMALDEPITIENIGLLVTAAQKEIEIILRLPDDDVGQKALVICDTQLALISSSPDLFTDRVDPDIAIDPELDILIRAKGLALCRIAGYGPHKKTKTEVNESDIVDVLKAALECYTQALELDPTWGEAWLEKANLLTFMSTKEDQSGDAFLAIKDEVITCYEKAIEFPETLPDIMMEIARFFVWTLKNPSSLAHPPESDDDRRKLDEALEKIDPVNRSTYLEFLKKMWQNETPEEFKDKEDE
jgi:tetratricopeptide (TPR) repeat protein